jgi:hypothetical protein
MLDSSQHPGQDCRAACHPMITGRAVSRNSRTFFCRSILGAAAISARKESHVPSERGLPFDTAGGRDLSSQRSSSSMPPNATWCEPRYSYESGSLLRPDQSSSLPGEIPGRPLPASLRIPTERGTSSTWSAMRIGVDDCDHVGPDFDAGLSEQTGSLA